MLGGESFFTNEFTAKGESGRVTFAPPTPGDVMHHHLDDEKLYAVDGAWLASDPAIDIETEFGGLKSMLAGASITPLTLEGTGDVLVEAFGGLETVELDAGESYHVDNENVVAWDGSVDFDAHRPGGMKSTLLSGRASSSSSPAPARCGTRRAGSTRSPQRSPRCSLAGTAAVVMATTASASTTSSDTGLSLPGLPRP